MKRGLRSFAIPQKRFAGLSLSNWTHSLECHFCILLPIFFILATSFLSRFAPAHQQLYPIHSIPRSFGHGHTDAARANAYSPRALRRRPDASAPAHLLGCLPVASQGSRHLRPRPRCSKCWMDNHRTDLILGYAFLLSLLYYLASFLPVLPYDSF